MVIEPERMVTSTGGPLVVMEACLSEKWRGIGGSSLNTLSADSDYARACAVKDYAGIIPLESDWVLVLGDMPMPTSFFLKPDGSPVIYRYMYAPENFDYRSIPTILENASLTEVESCEFISNSETLYVFDAATDMQAGEAEFLMIPILAGSYMIKTYNFEDEETRIIMHDFERVLSAPLPMVRNGPR
ncbi:hypothetical protein DB459_05965 [Bradyrhizobium sp. WD16]|nr:hypothetical protein DB459_05965 [Bradyrhizobium sp. WD16]